MDLIKALGRETEPGVISSKQKVELWRYNSNLVFKNGEHVVSDFSNSDYGQLFLKKNECRTWTCSMTNGL
jgi:hypothetical protein